MTSTPATSIPATPRPTTSYLFGIESGSIMENVDLEVLGGKCGELNEELNSNSDDEIFNPEVKHDLKPTKGQEFETLDDVKSFYNAYAKEAGFSIRNWSARKRAVGEIVRKEYVCYKQGKSSRILDIEKIRRRGTIKEGCNAKLAVVKSKSGTYVVSVFVEGHSHPLSTPRRTHLLRSHRNVSSAQKCLAQQMATVNIPQHQQFSFLAVQAGGIENIGCTQKDLYNYERDKRNEMKGHDGNMLLEFFKLEQGRNPSFTFKIEADEQKRITRCFWSDATSRCAYNFYGDVVIFDTTYNTKVYTDGMTRVVKQINEMVGCGTSIRVSSEQSNQMVDCGTSVRFSQSYEQSYYEPSQVRAKGCGKRLKGGKEKALGKANKYKARRCHGCGKVGQSHDKRNCPMLANRPIEADEDSTPDDATQDLDSLTDNEFTDF